MNEPARNAWNLNICELIALVNRVQEILWMNDGEWNRDRKWSSVKLRSIAELLEKSGLAPVEKKEEEEDK